jgi:iron complex outermembrane receptor protein
MGLTMPLCAAAIFSAGTAAAQTGTAAETNEAGPAVEDIVVTAQRRSERLQDVPMAITALSSQQLEASGIKDLENIGGRTPGVYFKNLNVAQPQIYIRGIGTVQFDNSSEAPVGLFVDEVYIARHSAGLASLYDIDRIEVLRGPQGTLYGRNTIGGAINVITRDPTRDVSGEVEAEFGSYGAFRTRAAVGGPLSETLSARVAFATNDRKGWTRNTVTGKRSNDENNVAGRLKLLFEPSDGFRLKLSANYARDRGGAFEQEIKGTQNLGIAPSQVELTPDAPYVSQSNVDGYQNRRVWGTSIRAEADLSDSVSLTAITGYQDHVFDGLRDLDVGPIPLIRTKEDEAGDQFSQELRLASTGDTSLKWLVGAYYFTEDSVRTEQWTIGGVFPTPPFSLFAGDYFWTYDGGITSYAAFGQMSYEFGDRFEVIAGLRYSRDRKSGAYLVSSNAALAVPSFVNPTTGFAASVSDKWNSLDPAITLNFKPSETSLIYASYKTGFKSGGFQHRPSTALVAVTPFAPEDMKAWEFGAKTEWLDRRLVLNLSSFLYDYKDLQQLDLVPNTTITFTSNVGSARVRGAELEAIVRPATGVELSAGYSYLDAKYRDYVDSAGIQRRGNYLNRAPKHSLNLAGQYAAEFADGSQLGFRLEYLWRDEVFFLQDNAPVNRDGPVGLLNGRIAFTSANESLTLSLLGTNLTKEVYCANQIVSVPSSFAATCVVGAPRQFSVNAKYRF